MRYKQDLDNETIANRINRSISTVESYFSEKEKQEFKQIFDPEEIEFMRFQVMQEIKDAKQNSKNYISKAISHPEVDPNAYLRSAKEERQTVKDFIFMMQEIGLFDKPKERKEHEDRNTDTNLKDKLAEAYREKMEEEQQNVQQE